VTSRAPKQEEIYQESWMKNIGEMLDAFDVSHTMD